MRVRAHRKRNLQHCSRWRRVTEPSRSPSLDGRCLAGRISSCRTLPSVAVLSRFVPFPLSSLFPSKHKNYRFLNCGAGTFTSPGTFTSDPWWRGSVSHALLGHRCGFRCRNARVVLATAAERKGAVASHVGYAFSLPTPQCNARSTLKKPTILPPPQQPTSARGTRVSHARLLAQFASSTRS